MYKLKMHKWNLMQTLIYGMWHDILKIIIKDIHKDKKSFDKHLPQKINAQNTYIAIISLKKYVVLHIGYKYWGILHEDL